jgi:hypothetical protein
MRRRDDPGRRRFSDRMGKALPPVAEKLVRIRIAHVTHGKKAG